MPIYRRRENYLAMEKYAPVEDIYCEKNNQLKTIFIAVKILFDSLQ